MYLISYRTFLWMQLLLVAITTAIIMYAPISVFAHLCLVAVLILTLIVQITGATLSPKLVVFTHFLAAATLSFTPYLLAFAAQHTPTTTLYLYSFLTLSLLLVTDFNNIFTKH